MNARVETVRILLAKAGQDEQAARRLATDPALGDDDAPLDRERALKLLGELKIWIQGQIGP